MGGLLDVTRGGRSHLNVIGGVMPRVRDCQELAQREEECTTLASRFGKRTLKKSMKPVRREAF